jgi:hypothetical protein
MRAVRSPDSSIPDTSPSGDAGRALQLFPEYILEHCVVRRQLCYQLLQPSILIRQLLQLSNLIHFQDDIFRLPTIKRLLADSNLADQLRYRLPTSA